MRDYSMHNAYRQAHECVTILGVSIAMTHFVVFEVKAQNNQLPCFMDMRALLRIGVSAHAYTTSVSTSILRTRCTCMNRKETDTNLH